VRFPALLLAAALGAGCSLGPTQKAPVTVYDLGMPGAPSRSGEIDAVLEVPDVVAPAWLDSPAIHYRLAYHDEARYPGYANSRWAAPPAFLLTERLRQGAAAASRGVVRQGDGARADYVLRLELEEFSQVFDTPEASRGVIRARASLVSRADRVLLGQTTLSQERPAPTPDAAGGVKALSQASDALVGSALEWTSKTLREAGRPAAGR